MSDNNSVPLMPVVFVGHGNPMNAITRNVYSSGWENAVKDIPRPEAVLCLSAHWDTRGLRVSASRQPDTVHDFWGFPGELYEVAYPCPGAPDWCLEAVRQLLPPDLKQDDQRGLDHGTWAVMRWMYPKADIPVFQVSLDTGRSAAFHYDLGRRLSSLREKGILIVGSGNMVHNLAVMDMAPGVSPYDWAVEADELLKDLIGASRHDLLVNYGDLGSPVRKAVPTPEHYYPLISVLGASGDGEPIEFFNELIDLRSVSMTSLRIG